MSNHEYATSIGSGTVPHVQSGPVHNLADGAYPVPDQRTSLKTRRGDGAVILNPEDFSVGIGLRAAAITVSTSAVPLPADPLEFRRALVVHNNGSVTVYLGQAGVTVSNGLPLTAGEKIAFDIQNNPNVVVYAVAASSVDVRIMELS
jgi:hypothetical protein